MARYAAIDVGTNSVLLLVAEMTSEGRLRAVQERAEITRLGRGVDQSKTLSPEAIADTLQVIEAFSAEARKLGASALQVCATSAARDASNGAAFLAGARERAGVEVEILSGDREAQLSFSAACADFGRGPDQGPLIVIDIGGGSTEVIYGGLGDNFASFSFRHSFDVGSVRLTERLVTSDPISPVDRQRIEALLTETFAALPPPGPQFRVVGVAGTVTSLFTVRHGIDPYDASQVHGGVLSRRDVERLANQLCRTPLAERREWKGLQPKRADVIPAGALILKAALQRLGAPSCIVSDRGLRWGLILERVTREEVST